MLATSVSSPLGQNLRSPDGAPLGEVFAWLSALYFRGKLAYAARFTKSTPGAFVIAPGAGLPPPSVRIAAGDLAAMGRIEVAANNPRFVEPLLRDARHLEKRFEHVVLLGSIATGKYVDPLLEVFGARLLFPADFVGRGDMSRGGMLLRASRTGEELRYIPVAGAVRHGKRPPRLPRVR